MANKKGAQAVTQPVQRRKAKPVTGNATKLKKLSELKKVNKELDKMFQVDRKKDSARDKLWDKQQKLREQLSID